MENLWTPWRSKYIESLGNDGKCIFCEAAVEEKAKKVIRLFKSENVIIILNLYPYNTAHTMVAPIRHIGSYENLNKEELLDLNLNIQKTIKIIKKLFNPDGFNIGANLGKIAGAGIPDHCHVHVVPRWEGDTNFMPIFSETKIQSFSIHEIWEKMYYEFNK